MPSTPMGESWFMGKTRRLYFELCEDLNSVRVFDLQEALYELAAGLSAFGPSEDNWVAWCDYLVPRLVPRCGERYASWLFEDLCTAALQVEFGRDPQDVPRQQDLLNTLGRSIMDASKWKGGRIVFGKVLHPTDEYPSQFWGWNHTSGDLAASLMLCARLIEQDDIDGWVQSIFAIECPFWHAQIMIWYLDAQPFLKGKIKFPSELHDRSPSISWSGSHVLQGCYAERRVAESFISVGKRMRIEAAFGAAVKSTDIANRLSDILAVSGLDREAGHRLRQAFG